MMSPNRTLKEMSLKADCSMSIWREICRGIFAEASTIVGSSMSSCATAPHRVVLRIPNTTFGSKISEGTLWLKKALFVSQRWIKRVFM